MATAPQRALAALVTALLSTSCTNAEQDGASVPAMSAPTSASAAGPSGGAAPAPEPSAPAAATDAPAAEPAAAAEAAPTDAPTAASTAPEDAPAPAAEQERLEEAARRALAEASRVAPGENDCETAYARLEALVASMAREAPGSVRELPPQDRFLSLCASLPEGMQRCLVVEHAIDHEAECAREVEALDPATRAALEGLMTGAD